MTDPVALLDPDQFQIDADPSDYELEDMMTVGAAPVAEAADRLDGIFAQADGGYGDMWVNDRERKANISFGDWEGELARAAYEVAKRRYPGYRIDWDTEQGAPTGDGWRQTFRSGQPVALEEAIWDDKLHPRWPPGSHDAQGHNIGGEFMRAGQTFMHGGHRWEIKQVAEGHVIADEAGGKIEHAETKVFTPTAAAGGPTIKGATPAPPVLLHSGKGKGAGHNTPIVDAVSHPETHDPSLKLPAGSQLTEDEWKTFGRVDQLYYRELMKRYGAWTSKGTLSSAPYPLQAKLAAVYSKAQQEFGSTDAVTIVKHAFSSQYGSSSGKTLSLSSIFSGIGSDASSLAVAQRKYAQAREVQSEINGLIAWDLMNRLRAPDVSVVHKSTDSEGFFGDIVEGQAPVMSALSNSWKTGIWHEPNSFAMAVPIRHVVLATDIVGGSYQNEHEMATADRLKVSPDTAAFFTQGQVSQSSPIFKWLQAQMNSNAAGGHVMKGLSMHLAGKGELPLPPAEADFTLKHAAGEKTYVIPPDDFMKQVEASVAANPGKTITEKVAVSELDLKPGDVIEGSTEGLRYLVIADPGTNTGLRYLALGKGAAGNYDSSEKNFTFSSWNATRKKVNLHFDIPEPAKEEEKPGYEPSQFAPTGDKVPVKSFAVGDKLRVNQDDWEITSQSTTQTTIKSLTSGAEATVNPLWKTQKLEQVGAAFEPKEGMLVVHGEQAVRITSIDKSTGATILHAERPDGSKFSAALGAFSPLPDIHPAGPPHKGDIFVLDGQKMTVTNVMKDGTVRARAAVPGATVQSFHPTHPALDTLLRPTDYALGGKGKLGQMPAGSLFSGSPIKNRPYMVLGTTGKTTHVLNLETGEKAALSKNKSYTTLVNADEAQPPVPEVTDATGVTEHAALKPGDQVTLSQLAVGDLFSHNGSDFQIVEDAGVSSVSGEDTFNVKELPSGVTFNLAKNGPTPLVYKGHGEVGETDIAPHTPVESGDLPDAVNIGGYTPFKSNAGPGNAYKHDKIKMMAEGTVFLDKNGEAWKVKQAGAQPIITNGQQLFKVDGNLRGKHAQHAKHEVVFEDHSPPVGGVSDATSKQIADTLTDNSTNWHTFADLEFKPGDKFGWAGNVWTVEKKHNGKVKAKNADTGAVKTFEGFQQPNSYSPHVTVAAPEEPDHADFFDQLEVGDKAVWVEPETGSHYPVTVTDNTIAGTGVQVKIDGEAGYIDAEAGELIPPARGPETVGEPEPAATGTPNVAKVSSANILKTTGPELAGNMPANSFAASPNGTVMYKSAETGHWLQVGEGQPLAVDPSDVLSKIELGPDVPHPASLQHTEQMVDIHSIRPGQAFFTASGKKYLMVGHGGGGATAVNLETGLVLPAPKDQHKDFELATWTTATHETHTAAPGGELGDPKQLATVPIGGHFKIMGGSEAVWKKLSPSSAVVVEDPSAAYKPGHTFEDMAGPGMVQPVLPPEAKSQVLADMHVGTRYWDPVVKAEFEVTAKDQHDFAGSSSSSAITVKNLNTGSTTDLSAAAASALAEFPVTHEGAATVGDLKKGDVFTVPEGYHGGGLQYEVLDPTPEYKQGYQVVNVKNVATGAESKVATALVPSHVEYLPPEAGWFKLPAGATAANTSLKPGDQFVDDEDHTHTVLEVTGSVSGGNQWVTTSTDFNPKGEWHSLKITDVKPADTVPEPETGVTPADHAEVSDVLNKAQDGEQPVYKGHVVSYNPQTGYFKALSPNGAAAGGMNSIEMGSYLHDVEEPAVSQQGVHHDAFALKIGDLNVGDTYHFSSGPMFHVIDKDGGTVHVQAEGEEAETLPAGSPFKSAVTVYSTPKPTSEQMAIKPYGSKYASGGKAIYPHVKELAPGEQFADKTGAKFTVYKQHGTTTEVQTPDGAMAHVAHTFEDKGKTKPTRVKKLSAAPPPTPEPPAADTPADVVQITHGSAAQALASYHGETPLGLKDAKDKIQGAKASPGQVVMLGNGAVVVVRPHDKAFVFKASDGSKFEVPADQTILAIKVARAVSKPAGGQSGATVLAKHLQPGDKIKYLPGGQAGLPPGGDHTWVVNGPSDDGQHWSLTNEEGWASTTIPKDDTEFEHVGYASKPALPAPVDAEHATAMEKADEWLQNHGVINHDMLAKVHQEAATFHAEHPEFSWGDVYRTAAIVHDAIPAGPSSLNFVGAVDGPNAPTAITKTPGEAVFGKDYKGDTFKDLAAGDVFKQSNSGTVWKVTSTEPFTMESVQTGLVASPAWEPDKPIIITKKATAPTAAKSAKVPASSLSLHPGDQFHDADGDLHTVVDQNPDTGQIETTWGGDGGDEHGPMVWDTDNSVMSVDPAKVIKRDQGTPVAPETPAAAQNPIPDYTGTKLTGGSSAGGTTGAQIKTGPNGSKWLEKTYGGNKDRVATELLANGVYRALGVNVADAGTLHDGGKTALAYPLVDGKPAKFSGKDPAKMKALGQDVMADMLVGNRDFAGLVDDNVLWNGDEPTRIDQGGTFEFRAQGATKEFGPVPDWAILSVGQGKNGVSVSESQLRQQAGHIAATLTPKKVDQLVDAAPFADSKMRERIRKNLNARVAYLEEFGHGQHDVPEGVKLTSDTSEPYAGEEVPAPIPDWMKEPGGPHAPEPEAKPDMPIVPYGSKWASGGKHEYAHIADLKPGDQFYDKEGSLYKVAATFGSITNAMYGEGTHATLVHIPHTFTDPKTGKVKPTRVKKVEP